LKSLKSLFILSVLSVLVSQTTLAEGIKVAIVKADVLLNTAPQYQQAITALSKEFEPQKRKIDKIRKDLISIEERITKDAMVMSDAQKSELERTILIKRREFKRIQEDSQELLTIRRNEELKKLQVVINEAITKVGKRDKYDLILYDGIAYADPRVDITEKVLEVLRSQIK
jgi:outer membrane protein